MKKLFLLSSLMIMSVIANAQINVTRGGETFNCLEDGEKTIYVGFAPYGMTSIKLSPESNDESIKYKYKSYWNVNISKEGKLGGFGGMVELLFGKAKLDKIKIPDATPAFDYLTNVEDIYMVDASVYGGQVFNQGRRFQFPLYMGGGVGYMNGNPFHHLTGHLAFKFRTNIYITERIGVYCGANYKVGFGGSGKLGAMMPQTFFVDAGLVISFD